MQIIYGVLGLAVLFAVGWAIEKMSGAALVGVNRSLFFRGEYKQGRQMREGFTFETNATPEQIMREAEAYVCVLDAPRGIDFVLYEAAKSDRGIAWRYGNASKMKLEVMLGMTRSEGRTHGVFMTTRWYEEDGLLEPADELKHLQLQIRAALQAADPAVSIVDGHPDDEVAALYTGVFSKAS